MKIRSAPGPVRRAPLLFVLLAACTGGEAPAPGRPAPETDATDAREPQARRERPRAAAGESTTRSDGASEPPRPIDPATVGRVTGRVLFVGTPPVQKPLAMGTDPACRDHAQPPTTEKVVVTDGGLRDVYVFVARGHEGWIVPEPPAEPVVLSQHGCLYVPHALALQTGQTLLVHNGDPTTHNVNMRAKRNGISRNATQGQNQADLSFRFERREHAIAFQCDIHPWMKAWLYVQDHPWFAVSGADGSFVIEGLPPGSYTLEARHEELGERRVEVTVPASGTAAVELSFEG